MKQKTSIICLWIAVILLLAHGLLVEQRLREQLEMYARATQIHLKVVELLKLKTEWATLHEERHRVLEGR